MKGKLQRAWYNLARGLGTHGLQTVEVEKIEGTENSYL
jgi:hypothetical protein